MNKCGKFKAFNLPNDDSGHAEIITASIKSLVESYLCEKDGGVDVFSVSVLFNEEAQLTDKVKLHDKAYLFFENRLHKSNSKQDSINFKFKDGLKDIIKSIDSELASRINYISIVVSYNKEPYIPLTKNNHTHNSSNEAFMPIKSRFNLNQITLNKSILLEINDILKFLDNRHVIYEDWGFKEIDPEPKIVINFYGPPGTGKTMTAHAIANEINSNILALNYADIESKYVGDAPKNLVLAFQAAKNTKSVLFFDEADSFLGKRINNVSSSSDQAVNSLRSQLLILLEEFDGVVIFATNLLGNYDKAFHSRIYKHIHFALPDLELRIAMIKNLIPKKLPLQNDAFTPEHLKALALHSDGFSGRELKSTVLSALINCINSGLVGFEQFDTAFQNAAINKKAVGNASLTGSSSYYDLADRVKKHLSFREKMKSRQRRIFS